MRSLFVVGLIGSLALGGCGRDKRSQDGLPPADKWAGGSNTAPLTNDTPMPEMGGGGMAGNNPHGGAMPTDDPHAGLGIDPVNGADPHAGMDMGSGGNPHGGGVDVAAMGLPPPDPNRAIDPGRFIKGFISVGAKAKDKAKPSSAIFIVVRKLDATGAPAGSPIAVDKLTWTGTEVAYELTEAQAMIAGTELVGDVIITARIDQDGDALSKQPGDITGSAHAKLPAENVRIVLDTVL